MNARGAVEFGRPTAVIRRGPVALRFDLRAALICALVAAATLAAALVSLSTGDFPVPILDVVSALLGGEDGMERTVVLEWRLPRVLAATVFGAALSVAGAIFQSLTRNPLGSPDVIGFATGSHTGALIVIIVLGGSYVQVAAGAVIGGLGTAAVVYLLAYRHGVQGFRLIIVGIAMAAMLSSVNTWLIMTAELETAISAAIWGAGSLGGMAWSQVWPALVVLAGLFVAAGGLARPLRQLEMGDDAARALGLNAESMRLALVGTGVGLTAAVTATSGPIVFVALAAPQIARRLTRTPGVALGPAAVMGAFLLVVADFVAQHALPAALPVGVVTVCIGGAYLIWLLVHEARRRT